MKRILVNIVFVSIFFLTLNGQSHNTNFEFSGMDKFWKIVEVFESNREPDEQMWNELFSTPGYNVLTIKEFQKEFFKNKFRVAYKPEKVNEYENALKNPTDAYYLKHYKEVAKNKSFLKSQINKLMQSSKNKIAANKALNFLPMSSVSDYPPVSFLIFANDGRGNSPIVIDLYATTDWDFIPFLAHEYHHWYRNRIVKINYGRVENVDRIFYETISQLEAEGIADQVDKADWFNNKSKNKKRERNYLISVEDSPRVIKEMNKLLEQISDEKSLKRNNFSRIKQIVPHGGHPTGFYMARMILKQLGKTELVRTVGNPFAFFKTYNNAVKLSGNYDVLFSSKAMKIVSELENKYLY